MPEKNKRVHDVYAKVETRAAEDGKKYIDGFIPYNSKSEVMWGFQEQIAPGAFKRTLNNGTDVYAFWAHDDSKVLGSRRSGTLTFDDRADGLHFTVEMRSNAINDDYYEAVARGDVVGVSFGFFSEQEEWDQTQEPALRTLKSVHLLEVSPGVAFPAYPGAQSEAAMRSVERELPRINEIRSQSKPKPIDTPAIPEPTPGPQETAPEARASAEPDPVATEAPDALIAMQRSRLDLLRAMYGIKLPEVSV
jgi:HK97 family phage prohead protease